MALGLERIPLVVGSDYQYQPVRANLPDQSEPEMKLIGFEPDQPTAPPAPPNDNRNKGTAGDLLTSLKIGALQLPGQIAGLEDIPAALLTGKRPISDVATWIGEKTGFTPGKWADNLQQEYSPKHQDQQAAIDSVWSDPNTGIKDIAAEYLKNPAYVFNQVVNSTPGMVAGGILSRSLMLAGRAAPIAENVAAGTAAKAAVPGTLERAVGEKWAAPIAGGIGEGSQQAGQQMDQFKGTDQRKNAIAALGSGLIDAVIGAGAGRVATGLGLETAETLMAKGFDKAVKTELTGLAKYGRAGRIAGGAMSEGILQEWPQSMQEQVWQNWAEGKPLWDGVARQGVEGAMAGWMLGGGANVLTRGSSTPPNEKPDTGSPSGPSSGGPIEGTFIPAEGEPPTLNDVVGRTYTQERPALPPAVPMLPAPEEGGPTPRQVQTATGLLKHSPQASPELLMRLMRVDETMAKQIFAHWQAANQLNETGNVRDGLTSGTSTPSTVAPITQEPVNGDQAAQALPQQAQQQEESAPAITPLDVQAHAAATSPFNAVPQPTEAQKEAGNYKVGRVTIQGLNISIENPAGSVRSGVDSSGRSWETELKNHYGYIRGSVGSDGDQVDVFLGPKAETTDTAYVIDQIDPKTGKYDEHKAVLGASSQEEAQDIYHANYQQGWKGLGAITAMSMLDFKNWIKSGDTKQPLALNPEQRGTNPVAESKAPAPEAGDGRVAPTQDSAVPDPLMAQYNAAKAAGDTKTVQRLAHEINQAKAKQAEAPKAAAPDLPFGKVGMMPNTAQVVSLQDHGDGTATIMRGEEPFYDFENGDPIKVSANATPEQVRQAITDANALTSKEKWFGVRHSQTANEAAPAPAVVKESVTAMATNEDEAKQAAISWLAKSNATGTDGHNTFMIGSSPFAKPGEILVNGPTGGFKFKISELKKGQTIAGKPVAEMSAPMLEQIAASSQPAAEKAKAEVARRAAAGLPRMTDREYVQNLLEMANMAEQIKDKAIADGDTEKAARYQKRIDEHRAELAALRAQEQAGQPLNTSGKPKAEPKAHFEVTNPDTNMTARVVDGAKSGEYNVVVRDDDSGEYVPIAVTGFKTLDAAIARAKHVTGVESENKPNEQPAPPEREKDSKGNPIYQKGDRVEYIEGHYDGRHGEISQASATRWQVLGFGARVEGEKTGVDYYYHVKTDEGTEFMASPGEIRFETAKPEHVVADPVVDGVAMDPERVYRAIGYDKQSAEKYRAAAQRARKASSIAEHKRAAERSDKKAAAYQAVWDEWAAKNPAEAEKIAPKPVSKPATGSAAVAATGTASDADTLKTVGLVVTKGTTNNGKEVWNVSGNTREHMDIIKRAGGRWYGPKKVWSFYNDDPSAAIAAKLPKTVTSIVGKPTIEMSDKTLEQIAKSNEPAAEKAKSELEAREKADEVDLGSLFDEVLAEETGPKTEAPAKNPELRDQNHVILPANSIQTVDGVDYTVRNDYTQRHLEEGEPVSLRTQGRIAKVVEIPYEKVAGQKSKGFGPVLEQMAERERTAGQAAASAVVNTAKGLADAIDGLGKLFGSNGSKLSSGLTFDEETYAKAKPLFEQAIAHFKDAGADLKEAMRAIVKMILAKFGPQVTENMKPYIVRFMEDVKAGKLAYDSSKEATHDSGTQGEGSGTLADVPSDDVGGTGRRGPSGRGADESGHGSGERNQDANGARGEAGRSGRNGTAETDLSSTGDGRARSGSGGRTGTEGSGVSSTGKSDDTAGPAGDIHTPSQNPLADYEIGEDVALGSGGQMTKYRDNVAAISLIKTLEAERRRATPAEQKILARYVGWGGIPNAFKNPLSGEIKPDWAKEVAELEALMTPREIRAASASTRNAHYTAKPVVEFMWRAAQRLGFNGGLVLEPSVGTGNFIGLIPKELRGNTHVTGIELDSLTARIAGALYPRSNIIQSGFEKLPLPEDQFDLAIGNPPFGAEGLRFSYKPELNGTSIHNQFFRASMDAVRPGGLQIMVVSRFLLDKQDANDRHELAKQARLLGAIRLPGAAFKGNALTEVVTDILVLQRRSSDEEGDMRTAFAERNKKVPTEEMPSIRDSRLARARLLDEALAWTETTQVADPAGGEPMVINRYFADNPHMIAGRLERSGSMRQQNDIDVKLAKGDTLEQALEDRMRHLPEMVAPTRSAEIDKRTMEAHKFLGESLSLYATGAEVGAIRFEPDGSLSHVVERVGEDGQSAITKITVNERTPWSPQLAMTLAGKWYRTVPQFDAKGKPVKVMKDGKPTNRNLYKREVFENESDVPDSLRLGPSKFERMKRLIGIRDVLVEQINLEVNAASVDAMEGNRAKLRKAYESFVKEYGYISEPKNANVVSEMPNEGLLRSLEPKFKREVTAAKAKATGMKQSPASAEPAAILTRPVGIPPARKEHAETIGDALAIAMSESGRLDLDRIQQLRGISKEAVEKELTDGETPLAFRDPEVGNALVDKNAYLSGNVRRKLEAARNAKMEKNIKALEAVQPTLWTSDQVTPKLGGTWIPPQVYAEFINHLLGPDTNAKVTFAKVTNTFQVFAPGNSAAATTQWGTKRMPTPELLTLMLNSRRVAVFDPADRDGGPYFNQAETDLAMDKRREVLEAFDGWLFQDADRRRTLTQLFNDEYNVRVNRQHDGSHMQFPGKVPDDIIRFRRGQTNAVWRGVVEDYVLYDHAVGAGKTFTGIARAMERRRMGLSKKPAVIVPNHLVKEWEIQTYRLYPGAKVLAAGKQDLSTKNRRRLFAKIATGDWDLVILPHSSFGLIELSPETAERFLNIQMDLAESALREAQEQQEPGSRFKSLGVKAAEALIKNLEKRLDAVHARKRDRLITFEQMGIDDLSVDEAHEFKNLMYSSHLTDVRGMGNKAGSQKALDLYMKVKYLHETKGSVAFMTGTPISNSAVEMYTIVRYLAPDILNEMELEHFDAFRTNFVEATAKFEPTDSGSGLKMVSRLGREWSNMRALMDSYYAVADVVTNDDILRWYAEDNPGKEFPLPKVKGGQRQAIAVQPTSTQLRLLNDIIAGFNGLDYIQDVQERNKERLRLMDRARKVSLHAKAVDPRVTDEPGGKLDRAVTEILRIYNATGADKGTQLVFLDRGVPKAKGDSKILKEYDAALAAQAAAAASGDEHAYARANEKLDEFDANEMAALRDAQTNPWNGYQHIKDGLTKAGIPSEEIAFIQDYNNEVDKEALFNAVRDGSVRVLIGSTPRMGAGTNVQERLVALHHIDATWKPSDIEQREGRIIRQGNALLDKYGKNFAVEILAYVTGRTVDAKLWDLNSTKLRMINAIRHYDGSFEMLFEDEDSVGMAEIAAIASGDPLLLERFKLIAEVDTLYRQMRSFQRRMDAVTDDLETAKRRIEQGPALIEFANERTKAAEKHVALVKADADKRRITINGLEYATREKAQWAASQEVVRQRGADEKGPISITIDGKEYTSKGGVEEAVALIMGDEEPFLAEVGDQKIIRRSDFARAMRDVIGNEFSIIDKETPVGSIAGLPVTVSTEAGTRYWGQPYRSVVLQGFLTLNDHGGKVRITAINNLMPADHKEGDPIPITVMGLRPIIAEFTNQLQAHAKNHYEAANLQIGMDSAKRDIPTLESQLGDTFKGAEELEQKSERLRQVEAELASRAEAATSRTPVDDPGNGMESRSKTTPAQAGVSTSGSPKAVAGIQAIVDKFKAHFKGAAALDFRSVSDVSEIPEKYRPSPYAEGVFHDDIGTIWLVGKNLMSAGKLNIGRVWQVLLHEAVGHFGLAQMMGERFKGILKQVFQAARAKGEVGEDIYQPGHADYATVEAVKLRYPKATDAEVAQEVLARMAETDPGRTLFGYVRAIVRQWVRDMARAMGVNVEMTTAELNDLVALASGYMRRGDNLGQQQELTGMVAASKGAGMESRRHVSGDSGRQYTAEQQKAFAHVGRVVVTPTLQERVGSMWKDIGKKMEQGIADQFAPLKDLNKQAYLLSRLSRGADGALEAMLMYGKVFMRDGVYDVDVKDGGVIEKLLRPLGPEADDFLWWVAGNRAGQLMKESAAIRTQGAMLLNQATVLTNKAAQAEAQAKQLFQQAGNFPKHMLGNQRAQKANAQQAETLMREAKRYRAQAAEARAQGNAMKDVSRENLMSDAHIQALKKLDNGQLNFDYMLPNGQKTRSRAAAYDAAQSILKAFNKSVLDIAEQSGLIDAADRVIWEREFYVPFYREMEGDKPKFPSVKSGLVRQKAFERLKGGREKLNSDLLANTILNWSHMLHAAAKNRAAKAALEAAEQVGAANRLTAAEKGSVSFKDNGKDVHFEVTDPFVLDAVTALEFAGFSGPAMQAMGAFKRWLTIGVTANPAFKVRNLIRDSIQAIGTAELSYNLGKNIVEGYKATDRKSQTYASMLASGGHIRFGSMIEGNRAGHVRRLVEQGVDPSMILDSESKLTAFWHRRIMPIIDAYNELGDRGETINRAAIYEQLKAKGMSHADASLAARDLMDFSMGGTWAAVRFLTQTVPFTNARIQGAYKLGRAAVENPKRFGYVVGAVALASLALLAAYHDDDDWKKREDWDRDNYWWFKVGGMAFRIPKPFEIGSIGTLAERSAELLFDKEMNGHRFGKRLQSMISNTFSLNPMPQLLKPIYEIGANTDSFTGRPIESMGMERLKPEDRFTNRTSEIAKAIGKAGLLSPLQVDHLIRGYFGWLGTAAVTSIDALVDLGDSTPKPTMKLRDTFLVGNFVETLPSGSSRYVTQMYEQAKEIEESYASWKHYLKSGDKAAAEAIYATDKDKINKYRLVENIKRAETRANAEVQRIKDDKKMNPEQKRTEIDKLAADKDRYARSVGSAGLQK